MIDLETMVRSLRLAWMELIFNENDRTWKRYLKHQLKPFGGLFFVNCNYDANDSTVSSQFYREFFCCGCQSSVEHLLQKTIGKESFGKIKKKYESGVVYVNDFLFHVSSDDSFCCFAKKKISSEINILQWAGLRHSMPDILKGGSASLLLTSPLFLIHNNVFDVKKKKSKYYYSLLVTEKTQRPTLSINGKAILTCRMII